VAPEAEGSIFGCLRERGRIEGDIISPVLPEGDGGTQKTRRARSRAS